MTDTTLSTTNPMSVGTEAALDAVITAANGGTASEAKFLSNILEASPAAISGSDLTLDGEGFTLTGSSSLPALVVNSGSEVFVGDLNINDGGAGAIRVGVSGLVNFLPSSAPPAGTTNIGIIAGAISGAGSVVVGSSADTTVDLPLVLDGVNTYTGATLIYDAVDLGTNGSIAGSTAVTLEKSFSVLDISGPQSAAGAAITEMVTNLTGVSGSEVYLGLNGLNITETASATFAGVIADSNGYATSGQVSISEAAGDTYSFTGLETYTGSTRILSGTLAITNGNTLEYSSNVSLKSAGATLDISGVTNGASINELTGVAGAKVIMGGESLDVDENGAAASFSGVISGSGAFSVYGPYELSLAGVNTYTGGTYIEDGGTLGISGAGAISASSGVTFAAGGGTLDIAQASGPVTVSGLTDDSNDLGAVTLGANTLVLTGASALYGVISGFGAVQVGSASATPAAALFGVDTYTGATKIYGTLTLENGSSIADSSNVSLKANNAELITEGDQSINELTGVTGTSVVLGGSLTVTEDGTAASFSGVISGNHGVEFAAAATGSTYTLTLADDNTYTGATTIDMGASIALVGSGALGTGDVTDDGSLSISGSGSGSPVELTFNNFAGTGVLTLGANSVDFNQDDRYQFSGVISGSGSVEISGSGGIWLSGVNTYRGVTQIDSGAYLEIGSALASSNIVDNGGLYVGDGSESAITLSTIISGTGELTLEYASSETPFTATITAADTFEYYVYLENRYETLDIGAGGSIVDAEEVYNKGGTVDISQATGGAVTLNYYYDFGIATARLILGANTVILGSDFAYVGGVISGLGAVQIASTNPDANFFSAQAYTGATKIYGTLYLEDAGSVTASSNVSLKASGANFDVSEFDPTSATPTVAINTLTGVTGSTVHIGGNTLDVTQTTAASFSGVIADGGQNTSSGGSLIVDGTAILTLAGINTYTGGTTVDKGAEIALSGAGSFNDSGQDTGTVTVNGVLDISGAAVTSMVVNGPATLTLLGLNGAGTLILGGNIADVTGGHFSIYTGTISGAGQLQVSGESTFQLDGSDTYTGLTTVNDDSVLALGSALASSGIVLADSGASLFIGDGSGSALTVSQVISGAGYVYVDQGVSSLPFTGTLTAANTFTGDTTVTEYNTLVLSGAGSINGSGQVENGGTVDISQATGPITLQHYFDFIQNHGSLILGGNTVTFGGGYTFVEGSITGTGGVIIAASNENATFDNVLAYTGSTQIYGSLFVEADDAIAASSNVSLKASGAELYLDAGPTVYINTLTGVTGSLIDLSSETLDVTQNTAASFSGGISGSGGLTIDAAGTAALTLLGANSYTGVTTDDGSLTLGIAGAIADSSAVIVDGTLTLGAASSVNELSGTGTINLATFALTDALASTASHDTVSGVISGSGSLTETGFLGGTANLPGSTTTTTSSSLTLSGASTFTGGITIEGGTVEIAAAGAAGTGAITFADASTGTAGDAGILKIDNSALTGAGTASESFANTIAGVSAQDVIDLTGLAYDTVPGPAVGGSLHFNAATGQLDVTEGNVTVALTIQGLSASTAANYHVYEDAHGGTYLTQIIPTDNTHYHP